MNVNHTSVSHFEMEFARKSLYHKLEVVKRMSTYVDYGKLFQGFKLLQSLIYKLLLNSKWNYIYSQLALWIL
jgi:hypothetical protein